MIVTEGDDSHPVVRAALSGDRASLLEAVRDKLARELGSGLLIGRDAAVISRELRALVTELDQLTGGEGSKVDDLAARRAARRTGTTGT